MLPAAPRSAFPAIRLHSVIFCNVHPLREKRATAHQSRHDFTSNCSEPALQANHCHFTLVHPAERIRQMIIPWSCRAKCMHSPKLLCGPLPKLCQFSSTADRFDIRRNRPFHSPGSACVCERIRKMPQLLSVHPFQSTSSKRLGGSILVNQFSCVDPIIDMHISDVVLTTLQFCHRKAGSIQHDYFVLPSHTRSLHNSDAQYNLSSAGNNSDWASLHSLAVLARLCFGFPMSLDM